MHLAIYFEIDKELEIWAPRRFRQFKQQIFSKVSNRFSMSTLFLVLLHFAKGIIAKCYPENLSVERYCIKSTAKRNWNRTFQIKMKINHSVRLNVVKDNLITQCQIVNFGVKHKIKYSENFVACFGIFSFFCFSVWVFFHDHSRIIGLHGKWEGVFF